MTGRRLAGSVSRKQKRLQKLASELATSPDGGLEQASAAELAWAHKFFNGSVRFERAFSSLQQLREASGEPAPSSSSAAAVRGAAPFLLRPQVAFAGRSNVGKSSLLNCIMGHGGLANVSSTPGHTRTLNFYSVRDDLTLVDLPGYGHTAGVSQAAVRQWLRAMGDYLAHMTRLQCVWLLIDSRRDISELDMQCRDFLMQAGTPLAVALTKADKLASLPTADILSRVNDIRQQLHLPDTSQLRSSSPLAGTVFPDRSGVRWFSTTTAQRQDDSEPSSAAEVLSKLRRTLRDGRDSSARDVVGLIEAQLRRYPANVALRELLSDAHLTAGEYKAGVEVCRSLLDDSDAGVRFRSAFRLAECAHRLGDLELAARHYRQAVELDEHGAADSVSALHMRYGFLLLDQSEATAQADARQHLLLRAEQQFSQCIDELAAAAAAAQDVELYYGRALARMRLRRIDDAAADLRCALAIDASYPPAQHKLAECLMAAGRFDDALSQLDAFVEQHQAYYQSFASHDERVVTSEYILSDALLRRARCLLETDSVVLAAADLDAVVQLHVEPHVALAFHLRGRIALASKDYEACIDANTRALSIVGTLLPALSDRSEAYRAIGQIKEADGDLDTIEVLREQMSQ